MYETKEGRSPRATHYVSLANGGVYPAMRNVPGFEDDNPADWRAASADEVEAYKNGKTQALAPAGGAVELSAPVVAAPRSIQLAEDDLPPAPQAVVQQAAAALPPAPPVPQDPPPLPPQFNGIPGLPPTGFGQNG